MVCRDLNWHARGSCSEQLSHPFFWYRRMCGINRKWHSRAPPVQAFAFVTDLYMGTSNSNASFRDAIGGTLGSSAYAGQIYNYGALDGLTIGLGAVNVRPYWAITYNPWLFQPTTASANATGQTSCLGFENAGYPQHYSCVPFGATAFDDCWKCPPKVHSFSVDCRSG